MNKPLKGFITYSHEDTAAKDELRKRLAVMEQQNELVTWDDGQLTPGDKALQKDILKKVTDSNLLLYLVSAASLASKNCNKELAEALKQEIRVIPIILEHCDWLYHQISDFEALPYKGKPVSKWKDLSEGWQNVVDGIREAVDQIKSQSELSSGKSEEKLRAEGAFNRGNFMLMLGQLGLAIESYSQSIDLMPSVASSYNNRGMVYSVIGNNDLAIKDYTEAIRLKSDYAEAYNNRGAVYGNKREYNKAIEDYTRAIGLRPDYAEAYNNRGTVYGVKNQHNKAIEDYTRAIKLRPDYAEAYNNRGIDCSNKGEYDRAIEDYAKAIALRFDYAEAYFNRGNAQAEKGDTNSALEDYSIALVLKPDYVDAYYNRGAVYLKTERFEEAITDYSKIIGLKPELAAAYTNRGIAYNRNGEVDKAIEDFHRAIQLKPEDYMAYSNRGVAYVDKGDFNLAMRDHNKAVELSPENANSYYNRGNAYVSKGEFDKAIKDYTRTIELNPRDASAYGNRGVAYSNTGNYDKAIEDHTRVIGLNSENALAYYNRGNAYHKKGELNLALEDYNIAIRLDPYDARIYTSRGNVYSDKGEHDQAIENYTTGIKFQSQFAPAVFCYYNRGNAYRRKGEYNQAIKDYTTAIKFQPKLLQAYYTRAEVSLRMGEWERARADLHVVKNSGVDIIASFRNDYKNVEAFEQQHRVKLPKDIGLLLTQHRRSRYPKTQGVLDADGNPLESPDVINLRSQLRNAGTPLGEYINTKPAFGINITPTEAFVIDKTTRDKFIVAHRSSADILKPFLHGRDLRRWHVDTPNQWLIFAHRGIAINDYPAILKHLEKYRESLGKRKGKQAWYELQASTTDTERFAQPKLVCPNFYNHQTFAVDTAGYYYGNTSYLIPTEEVWLCGLLNSRTVEWFYSQVSDQLTGDELRARSGYMQQIPVPNLTSERKTLIAKIVDYLIYLQQQPTTNSKDLKHARDAIMLGYFERIIDGLVYEAYLSEELHQSNKYFFQPLLDEQLPSFETVQGDKMSVFRDIFELLYERTHPIRRNLFFLDSVKSVRIIEGKL